METSTDYIEDYINNKISVEERKHFDERLNSDRTFAGEVKEHVMLLSAFDEKQAEELLNRFGTIESKLEGSAEKKLKYHVYLRWAAAIIVLAVLSLVVYQKTKVTNSDLFLAYYTPYPNVENPVSRSGAKGEQVWQLYENGNYAEALIQFELVLVVNKGDYGSRFYLGISALELNRLTIAEKEFSIVAANKENNYTEQAQWYLALSYLKANKIKKAKTLLKRINNSTSSYKTQANKLLRDLR